MRRNRAFEDRLRAAAEQNGQMSSSGSQQRNKKSNEAVECKIKDEYIYLKSESNIFLRTLNDTLKIIRVLVNIFGSFRKHVFYSSMRR